MDAQEFDSRCENCIIKQLNALKELNKDQLKQISASKVSKKIKKGDPIFQEGERLSGVFCVRDGISKLSKLSENGKDQIVKIATKGEVLGQRSIIAEEKANLSAVALNDMEICFIPKSNLADGLQQNVNFTNAVLKQFAHDLREADDGIVDMAQKSVPQRLAQVLLYLETKFGTDSDGYLRITISRADIASVVGTATELCIRNLTKFKKENLIDTRGKQIKIKNKPELQALANGL